MAYPTKYTRQYDFQAYQDATPNRPLPGDKVNADYNAVVTSIDEIVEFLKLHSRSDGALTNGVVTVDSLSEEVAAALGLSTEPFSAAEITFAPAGGISATSVQAAIVELDTEKAAASHTHAASAVTSGTFDSGRISAASVTQHIAAIAALLGSDDIANDSNVAGSSISDALDALATELGGIGAGLVTSVHGRTGNVVAVANDYAASQVDNDSGVTGSTVADALDALDAAIAGAGAVASVFGRTGAVVAATSDYDAVQVDFTPAGSLSSTNVQAALAELDTTVFAKVESVSSRTALKAIDTTQVTTAFLTESGRVGLFVFRAGNYASSVTADTQEGIYIAANAVATTAGAWVRAYDGEVDVRWFGWAGNGSTNDGAAVQATFNTVSDGTRLYVPKGTYLIGPTAQGTDANAVITIPDGKRVSMRGDGFGSLFSVHASTPDTMDVFKAPWTTSTRGVTFEDFAILPVSTACGRHGICFDFTGSDTVLVYQVIFRNLLIVIKSQTGYSICVETNNTSTSGGMAYSMIEECLIDGARLANVGDNMAMIHNTIIPSHATQPLPNVYFCGVEGAHNFDFAYNVVAGLNTHLHVAGCWHAAITYNWFESPYGTDNQSTNNALIDLAGDENDVRFASVIGNTFAVHLGTGDPTPIRMDNAIRCHIDGNSAYTYNEINMVTLSANAEDNVIGVQMQERPGVGSLYGKVSDSGVRTQFVDYGVRYDTLTVSGTSITIPSYMALDCTLALTAGSAYTVATISGHKKGRRVTLKFGDSNVTIAHDADQQLDGETNFTGAADDTLTLVSDGSVWYEVGRSGGLAIAWTPTLSFGGATTGITYTTQTGKYVRRGKIVTFWGRIVLSSKGSATGNMAIGGFPVASEADHPFGVELQTVTSGVGDTYISGYMVGTAASAVVRKMVTGTMTTLTDADFTGTTTIRFGGSYLVA